MRYCAFMAFRGRRGLMVALLVAVCPAPRAAAQHGPRDRVIHVFDFTEADNLYPVPKHWIRFPDRSLPVYPDPQFPRFARFFRDQNVGHHHAPALYIDAGGRNAALRYKGNQTPITPGDYLVTGWIMPDRLVYARAAISAYYLDWRHRPIAGTQRFSRLIGADVVGQDKGSWHQVRVALGTAPPEALAIGITCWVVQQQMWRPGPLPAHYILHRDVPGGAWFDDIVVYGQPSMRLDFDYPGNVVELPQQPRLSVQVRDVDPNGLSATLGIIDDNGETVYRAAVPVASFTDTVHPQPITPPITRPGVYSARLDVQSAGKRIARRVIRFAVFEDFSGVRMGPARRLGVSLGVAGSGAVAAQIALVEAAGAGAVTIPLWTPHGSDHQAAYADDLARYLAGFGQRQISVTGLIGWPPPSIEPGHRGPAAKLIDLLIAGAPAIRDAIKSVAAPYAVMFDAWQIGADADARFTGDARAPQAAAMTRTILSTLVSVPQVVLPVSNQALPTGVMDAGAIALRVADDVQPPFIADNLAPFVALGAPLSVSFAAPDWSDYDPKPVLDAWAMRIVYALYQDVRTVSVPPMWNVRSNRAGQWFEPNPELLAYRTIARLIGDATPHRSFTIADAVQALSFQYHGQATLVLWAPRADDSGQLLHLQLGPSARSFDLTGHPVAMSTDERGVDELRVGRRPIFVTGVQPWLIAMMADTTLTPGTVAFQYAPTTHQVTLNNTAPRFITGHVSLTAPPGWSVVPSDLPFALKRGESVALDVSIRQAGNETAGEKHFRADVRVTSDPPVLIPLSLPLRLGADQLDVSGYTIRSGNTLIVRHRVTNLSDSPMSLRGFASLPGQTRRYRSINELLAGQSVTLEYRFAIGAGAASRPVRLGLRRLNGTVLHNLRIPVR